ncbi:hypothetical protein ACP70R_025133 [Stipagrostis hirtigluma subsp. patula]
MAQRWLETGLKLAVVATLWVHCWAQATVQPGSFPAMPNCPPAPITLSPCIGYVFGVGSASLDSCCAQLRGFLQAQAPCLCAASKLAPSPVGLLLGQAQSFIPNICNLPSSPCDDLTGENTTAEASTPSAPGTSSPATTPLAPAGQVPSATTPTTTTTDADPPLPPEDSPATATAPDQAAPAGAGSKKLPQLLHAAGATCYRGMAAGTVFITVLLASVATIFV